MTNNNPTKYITNANTLPAGVLDEFEALLKQTDDEGLNARFLLKPAVVHRIKSAELTANQSLLWIALHDKNPLVRRVAAKSKHATAEMLLHAVVDKSPDVREQAVVNQSARLDALLIAVEDCNWRVVAAACRHKNANKEILEKAWKRKLSAGIFELYVSRLRLGIVKNRSCPRWIWDEAVKSEDRAVRDAAELKLNKGKKTG